MHLHQNQLVSSSCLCLCEQSEGVREHTGRAVFMVVRNAVVNFERHTAIWPHCRRHRRRPRRPPRILTKI